MHGNSAGSVREDVNQMSLSRNEENEGSSDRILCVHRGFKDYFKKLSTAFCTFLVGAAEMRSKSTLMAPAWRKEARSFSSQPRDKVQRMKVNS